MKSPKYLKFVKSLPCCHCKSEYNIDPHHIISIGMGTTGGKASDLHAMPLCRTDHTAVHRDPDLFPQTKWMIETQEKAVKQGVLKV